MAITLQLDLLSKIAARTRETPPELFKMGVWKEECSSAGCAIGSSADILADAGLRFMLTDGIHNPYYMGKFNFRAVADVLGIREGDAVSLFGPSEYVEYLALWNRIPPERVANRIECFVENVRTFGYNV